MTYIYKRGSSRNFIQVSKSTPEEVGPGIYNVTPVIGNKKPMKAPFGTNSHISSFDPPKDVFPSPCSYNLKNYDTRLSITSSFHSGSDRSNWLKRDNVPDPTYYSRQIDWARKPYVKPSYKMPAPKYRPTSEYVGQDIEGFIKDKNGKWVPNKKYIKGPEFIGPGSYNPTNALSRSIPISLGHSAHVDSFASHADTPGPGRYHIGGSINTNLNVSKWARSASRPSIFKSDTSDIGNYIGPEAWVGDSIPPSSTFKSKTERQTFPKGEETPDPTTYFRMSPPRPEYNDNSCFGVRTERKTFVIKNDVPGPGAYSNTYSDLSNTKPVSIRPLVKMPDTNYTKFVPGPGAYDDNRGLKPGTRSNSVFVTRAIRRNHFDNRSNDVPGPGAYSPTINDRSHQILPSIHEIKGGSRSNWVNKTLEQNPSPDMYHLSASKPRKLTISPLGRIESKPDNVPGPGAYNVLHGTIAKKSYNSAVTNLD